MGIRRVALFVLLCVSGFGKASWEHLKTPHFEIYSCMRSSLTWEYAQQIELFHAWFYGMQGESQSKQRTIVLLFPDYQTISSHLGEQYDRVPFTPGLFLPPGSYPIILAGGVGDESHTRETLFHECTHLILHRMRSAPPLWFDEGLAQCFQTLEMKRGRLIGGQSIDRNIDVLRKQKSMPLGRLFSIRLNSPEYSNLDTKPLFYAQTWMFLHLCLFGEPEKYQDKLGAFVDAVSSGAEPTEEVFRQTFGCDFAEMERRLDKYLYSGNYRTKLSDSKLCDVSSAKLEPADPDEIAIILDCVRQRHFGVAGLNNRDEFESMRAGLMDRITRCRHPEIMAYAAYAARGAGELDLAAQFSQRAIDLGSSNPQLYAEKVRAFIQVVGFDLNYRMPAAESQRLRALVDRGLSFDPENEELLAQLAYIEAFSETIRTGSVDFLQKSAQKIKDKDAILLSLAIIHRKTGDLVLSRGILDSMAARPESRFTPLVRYLLEQGQADSRRNGTKPGGGR